MKGQKGFTLIELLIVIVILGVLAAVIIPNLKTFLGSGDMGAANAELASVRTSIIAYGADTQGLVPVNPDGTLNVGAISQFYVGTIKGIYHLNSTGVVVSAENGSWSNRIRFNTTTTLWEKTL